ncbi:MAG: hypothetical protein AABX08_00050 [Nanoarchaeota archaeon]
MAKSNLDDLKHLRFTYLECERGSETIQLSQEQFDNARCNLYRLVSDSDPPDIDDFTFGPWGYRFPYHHKICGCFVEDRYNYLTVYHKTEEDLEQLAEKLGLPARTNKRAAHELV